jgi:hypothetical protein
MATTSSRPVLVVPGYLASLPKSGTRVHWILNRGLPASRLQAAAIYEDNIVQTLKQNGFSNANTVPYDWRLPLALNDGERDGIFSRETAAELTDSSLNTQVKYLTGYLKSLVEQDPSITKVDLIGHSNGNNVIRAYMQSIGYGGSFTSSSGKALKLPTVGSFIQIAAPSEGAALAWNFWNNNVSDLANNPDLLGSAGNQLISALTTLYDAVRYGAISVKGPDLKINRASITDATTGKPNAMIFLRQYVPSLATLNPTYNFLYDINGNLNNINSDPASANSMLLDLNALSKPGSNPWTAKADTVYATYGVTMNTVTQDKTHVGPGGSIVSIGGNGKPVPTIDGQTWYSELSSADSGDSVVPLDSLQTTFVGDSSITLKPWGNGTPVAPLIFTPTNQAVDHSVGIVKNTDVLGWIVQQLQTKNSAIGETNLRRNEAQSWDPITQAANIVGSNNISTTPTPNKSSRLQASTLLKNNRNADQLPLVSAMQASSGSASFGSTEPFAVAALFSSETPFPLV